MVPFFSSAEFCFSGCWGSDLIIALLEEKISVFGRYDLVSVRPSRVILPEAREHGLPWRVMVAVRENIVSLLCVIWRRHVG